MLAAQTIPPISNTAFFTCGIREQDAQSKFPICNDIYAKNFMTKLGRYVYEKYRPNYFAKRTNYVRPKIIDDLTVECLKENPGLKIILIGAGFDSRAYRLAGGDWLEIDETAIIRHKNKCLPIDKCTNPLKRVTIDYAKDNLTDILNEHISSEECLFIIEGVFMYLEIEEIKSLLKAINSVKSKHILICDLMTYTFSNTFARGTKRRFDDAGANVKCQCDTPESIFIDHKYSLLKDISIIEIAVRYGAIRIPKFLMFKKLRKGFRVMSFKQDCIH